MRIAFSKSLAASRATQPLMFSDIRTPRRPGCVTQFFRILLSTSNSGISGYPRMPASTRGMKKLTTDPSKVPELRSPSITLLTPSLEGPLAIERPSTMPGDCAIVCNVEGQETAVVEPSNRQCGPLPYLGQYVSALGPSMEASNNLTWEFRLLDQEAKDPSTPFDTNLAMKPPGEERVAVTVNPKMINSQNETRSHDTTNPREAGSKISQKLSGTIRGSITGWLGGAHHENTYGEGWISGFQGRLVIEAVTGGRKPLNFLKISGP
jgi:hypothetical protein